MLSSAEIAERYRRLRAQVGPRVTIVAATKYVPLADMALLVEAGIEVVGENRAQDLDAKQRLYGSAFRWHFIGRLQSNKVKIVNRACELVHSLDSLPVAARLEVPALVQVNLAAEGSKAGVSPGEIDSYLAYDVRGLAAMPPQTGDAQASRRWFRRLAELAAERDLVELSMGTTQDYPVAVEEGATFIRVGSVLFGERLVYDQGS